MVSKASHISGSSAPNAPINKEPMARKDKLAIIGMIVFSILLTLSILAPVHFAVGSPTFNAACIVGPVSLLFGLPICIGVYVTKDRSSPKKHFVPPALPANPLSTPPVQTPQTNPQTQPITPPLPVEPPSPPPAGSQTVLKSMSDGQPDATTPPAAPPAAPTMPPANPATPPRSSSRTQTPPPKSALSSFRDPLAPRLPPPPKINFSSLNPFPPRPVINHNIVVPNDLKSAFPLKLWAIAKQQSKPSAVSSRELCPTLNLECTTDYTPPIKHTLGKNKMIATIDTISNELRSQKQSIALSSIEHKTKFNDAVDSLLEVLAAKKHQLEVITQNSNVVDDSLKNTLNPFGSVLFNPLLTVMEEIDNELGISNAFKGYIQKLVNDIAAGVHRDELKRQLEICRNFLCTRDVYYNFERTNQYNEPRTFGILFKHLFRGCEFMNSEEDNTTVGLKDSPVRFCQYALLTDKKVRDDGAIEGTFGGKQWVLLSISDGGGTGGGHYTNKVYYREKNPQEDKATYLNLNNANTHAYSETKARDILNPPKFSFLNFLPGSSPGQTTKPPSTLPPAGLSAGAQNRVNNVTRTTPSSTVPSPATPSEGNRNATENASTLETENSLKATIDSELPEGENIVSILDEIVDTTPVEGAVEDATEGEPIEEIREEEIPVENIREDEILAGAHSFINDIKEKMGITANPANTSVVTGEAETPSALSYEEQQKLERAKEYQANEVYVQSYNSDIASYDRECVIISVEAFEQHKQQLQQKLPRVTPAWTTNNCYFASAAVRLATLAIADTICRPQQ